MDPIQSGRIWIRLAYLSLVSFRHLPVCCVAGLYPVSIYIIFPRKHISYCFLSSCRWAGASSLEVKYGIFRNGDEGTWPKHLEWYSQCNIVDPYPSSMSSMPHASCRRKKPSRWESISTHTHTHTHTHATITNFRILTNIRLLNATAQFRFFSETMKNN